MQCLFASGKCKSKLHWDSIFYPLEWLRSITQVTGHVGKDMEQEEYSSDAPGSANCTANKKIGVAVPQKYGNWSSSKIQLHHSSAYTKGNFIMGQRYLFKHVNCCFIHNILKVKVT